MRLLLVRHARAFERDPAAWSDDLRRPLTADGRESFGLLAKRLGRLEDCVHQTLASPAVRAWQTAQLLHERAGWPAPERCDALLPEPDAVPSAVPSAAPIPAAPPAGPDLWTQLLAGYPDDAVVAWVGHEPMLGRIASWLLSGDLGRVNVRFKKGTVVAIERERGLASLAWMITPRIAARWK